MITIYLNSLDYAILISIPCVIVIGVIIFFLAGVHRVPKNHCIIIEKAGKFDSYFDKGVHFKMPVIYQKAATYCIVPQVRRYIAQNGNHLDITYQIKDPVKYHSFRIKFDDLMLKIEKENSDVNITILQDSFAHYGLEFISIKKSLN